MKYRRRDHNFANDGDTSFNQRVNMGFYGNNERNPP
jgi:hypothetical protein